MQFIIEPTIDGKQTRLYVNFIKKTTAKEFYQITGKNKIIIISCNRPVIEAKGLKNFPITWNLEEGQLQNSKALEKITEAIEWSWKNF